MSDTPPKVKLPTAGDVPAAFTENSFRAEVIVTAARASPCSAASDDATAVTKQMAQVAAVWITSVIWRSTTTAPWRTYAHTTSTSLAQEAVTDARIASTDSCTGDVTSAQMLHIFREFEKQGIQFSLPRRHSYWKTDDQQGPIEVTLHRSRSGLASASKEHDGSIGRSQLGMRLVHPGMARSLSSLCAAFRSVN